MNEQKLGDLVKEKYAESIKARGVVNILIAGRTGVGKSTLINSVFQGNLAVTGQGRPVTKNVREYSKERLPLRIIDTRGLEMADFDSTLEELVNEVKKRKIETDPSKHIHVGWVCISEDSRRVEDAEINLTEQLSGHFPMIGVITKARADNGFRHDVQKFLPGLKNVVRIRAMGETFDEGHKLGPMGLAELIQLTNEVIPEGQKKAFIAAQKVSITLKKNKAHGIVAGAAVAAAAIGATPIPFSDAFLLVPAQIGMLAGVTAVFGLEFDTGFLSTLVTTSAGCTATTFVGRALVANLLKLFPGAGSAVGGMISAGTASSLTVALGEAYINVLVYLYEQNNGEQPSQDAIIELFREKLLKR